MSKIGKQLIDVPANIKVEIKDNKILVEGQKGKIEKNLPPEISVEFLKENGNGNKKGKRMAVKFNGPKEKRPLWGTWQRLIKNMLEGVSKGFEKRLKIIGIGYKANIEGKNLVLKVGFINPIKISTPEGVDFSIEKDIIKVFGVDKEKVGNTAAAVRRVKPPEPYKGKGIRYENEIVRKKAGKKAAVAAK